MNPSNGIPIYPPVPSSEANTTTQSASASLNQSNTTLSPPTTPVIPLPEMLLRIQAHQADLLADLHSMQQQQHDLNNWIAAHPQYSNDHHRVEITINLANPARQYLQDDQSLRMTILEFKAVLNRVLCWIRKSYGWWEGKKEEVSQRLQGPAEARKKPRLEL